MSEPTPFLKDAIVVIVTIGVFALVTYTYLKLEPTIVLPRRWLGPVSPCPDRWVDEDGECRPMYETHCNSFKPDLYRGKECEIARACGTSWKGLCN